MSDLDISKTIPPPEPEEKPLEKKPWTEGKIIAISIILLGVILAIAYGGWKITDKPTGASTIILTVDELHELNRQGKLDPERGYLHNGYSFVKHEGLWWTELMLGETLVKIPLHFGPRDVENIPLTGALNITLFNLGEEVYIAIDPNVTDKYYTLAISELSFNIVKGLDRIPVGSCTKEDPACDEREIISCNNTKGRPSIELALGPAGIQAQESCLLVSGTGYEIVKAVDRLLWQWYGVMERAS